MTGKIKEADHIQLFSTAFNVSSAECCNRNPVDDGCSPEDLSLSKKVRKNKTGVARYIRGIPVPGGPPAICR